MAIMTFDDFVKSSGATSTDIKLVEPIVQPKAEIPSVSTQEVTLPEEGQQPGYFERLGEEAIAGGAGIVESVQKGAELLQEGNIARGLALPFFGAAGGAARTIFSPLTAAIAPAIQDIVEKTGIVESEKAQQAIQGLQKWSEENPEDASILGGALDIIFAGGAGKIGKTAIEVAKPIAEKTAEITGKTFTKVGEAAAGAVKPIAPLTRGAAETIAGIPSRIGTNIEARQIFEEQLTKLPSKVAKTAARNGVDLPDIRKLYSISQANKPAVKELADTIKKFATGEAKIDPIEIVGKPIVNRLKKLDIEKDKIGSELGKIADTFGTIQRSEINPSVFKALTSVPGLEGLTTNLKGILNFKNTSIASSLTKADRNAIQKAYTQAISTGTGKQKHLLRQELFEVLGGKKAGLEGITETQDKALQAIREGLSDVLESKNASYKTLSNEYRKIVRPMSDMRKFMKFDLNEPEDILDMSAGLLARRITSNAPSNPTLRLILRKMDQATKKPGITEVKIEELQDIYNILNKYYDIAGKTTLQGQVQLGTGKAITEIPGRIIQQTGGITPAVQQKAIDDILK